MIKPLASTISVLLLLIVLLIVSPASAIPLSRSLKSARIVPDYSAQGRFQGLRLYEEEHVGRKLLVVHTDDYGGTGANSKHDPSTGRR